MVIPREAIHGLSLLSSRKLLSSNKKASLSVSPMRSEGSEKALEADLRKAPDSGPNPTQNK